MSKNKELLHEIQLMVNVLGNGFSVETDVGDLSKRCGLTVSRIRKELIRLQKKAKIRISPVGRDSVVGGYERLEINILF